MSKRRNTRPSDKNQPQSKRFKSSMLTHRSFECIKNTIRNYCEPFVKTDIDAEYIKIFDYYYKTKKLDHGSNPNGESITLNYIQNQQLIEWTSSPLVNVLAYDKLILLNADTFTIKIIDYNAPSKIDVTILKPLLVEYFTNIPISHGQKFTFSTENYRLDILIKSINDNKTNNISYFARSFSKITLIDAPSAIILYECIKLCNDQIKASVNEIYDVTGKSIKNTLYINRTLIEEKIAKYLSTEIFHNGYKFIMIISDIEYHITLDIVSNVLVQSIYKILYLLSPFIIKVCTISTTSDLAIYDNSVPASVIKIGVYRRKHIVGDKKIDVNINKLESITRHHFDKVMLLKYSKLYYENNVLTIKPYVVYPDNSTSTLYTINSNTKIKFQTLIDENINLIKNNKIKTIEKIILNVTTENRIKSFHQIKSSTIINRIKKIYSDKTLYVSDVLDIYYDINTLLKLKISFIKLKNTTKSDVKYRAKIYSNTVFEFEIDPTEMLTIDTNPPLIQDFSTQYKIIEDKTAGLAPILKDTLMTIYMSYGQYRSQFIESGLDNIRGMIFHGPPGTGKTSVAKSIADFFGVNGKRLIIVKGPEIFNKYVGESEKNIRQLFEPARNAYKLYGVNSDLYMILIDEMDSIMPTRSSSTTSAVRNTIVNQFLAEIDGINKLPNVLIIGTTNKLDLIDPAVMRSGRLGLHIKFDNPNQSTRAEIFKIYLQKHNTVKLSTQQLDKLAKLTDGFTGADIKSSVNIALVNHFKSIVLTNDKDKLLDMKLIIDAINTTKLSTSTIQQNEPPINMYL